MAAPKKTRGLGKGLDALFGDAEVSLSVKKEEKSEGNEQKKAKANINEEKFPQEAGGIEYIDINNIKPNSGQPRKTFDEEKLQELASSIESMGLYSLSFSEKPRMGTKL